MIHFKIKKSWKSHSLYCHLCYLFIVQLLSEPERLYKKRRDQQSEDSQSVDLEMVEMRYPHGKPRTYRGRREEDMGGDNPPRKYQKYQKGPSADAVPRRFSTHKVTLTIMSECTSILKPSYWLFDPDPSLENGLWLLKYARRPTPKMIKKLE